MLATANIRKSKGHTISLGIMLIIAGMMLSLGLLMLLNYNTYFNKLADELNTSDSYITVPYRYCTDEVYDYLKNHSNVKSYTSEYTLPISVPITRPNGSEIKQAILFFNNEIGRENTKKKFIGEYLPLDNDSIYVAYYFNIEWVYELGDTINLDFGDGEKSYKINGFVEDVYNATPNLGAMSGYLSDIEFNRIFENTDKKCVDFFINQHDDTAVIETDLNEYIKNNIDSEISNDNDISESVWTIHFSLCKLGRTMMANLLAAIMVLFAVIVVAICMIIIRFRIKNSIEEDMTKIGSLKAMGYTSKQIITSIMLQFVIIAFIGSVIGVAISFIFVPNISDLLAHQSALLWEQGFSFSNSVLTLTIIILFVLIIAFSTAKKIRKINPIVALRGGITTHNFKKNHMPLDKSSGNLSFVLGMKSIFQNIKQSLMIGIITISVSFVGTYGLIMFYNTTVDTTTFAETTGTEVSNIIVMIDTSVTDSEVFLNEILERDDVDFAQYITHTPMLTIEGMTINTSVMEDYSTRRTVMVYDGRYPIHDNEIAINGNTAKLMGKNIGDTVSVKGQNGDVEYLITGFVQGSQYAGLIASMTYSGYIKLFPSYEINEVYIYLKDKTDTEKCLQSLLDDYGDVIKLSVNMDKEIEKGMGMYTDIIALVGGAILVISFMIIILVLYFILNSLVIKQKHELGIQKAIGFTTIQLMNQMTFGVMPSIIFGIIAGCILGAYATNPIMSIAQNGMGIVKAHYIIRPDWVIVFGIAVAIISYASSMLITSKIHRISAYALVTE